MPGPLTPRHKGILSYLIILSYHLSYLFLSLSFRSLIFAYPRHGVGDEGNDLDPRSGGGLGLPSTTDCAPDAWPGAGESAAHAHKRAAGARCGASDGARALASAEHGAPGHRGEQRSGRRRRSRRVRGVRVVAAHLLRRRRRHHPAPAGRRPGGASRVRRQRQRGEHLCTPPLHASALHIY